MLVRILFLTSLLTVLSIGSWTSHAYAQEPSSPPSPQESSQPAASPQGLAVGGHVGLPTGLSLKLKTQQRSYDLLLAWNLRRFFLLHSHALLVENALPQQPQLHYYAGPGLAVNAEDGRLSTGLSSNVGIFYLLSPFEFFAQVTPRLEIVPSTRLGITTGAGIRVFL